MEYIFTCTICLRVQADEPLDALIEPCGHRFHKECWHETHKALTRNHQSAVRLATVQQELGVADVQLPLIDWRFHPLSKVPGLGRLGCRPHRLGCRPHRHGRAR